MTSAGTTRTTCRSCTASAASGTSRRAPSTTSPGTTTPARCGSATAPTTSSSTTSGAPCWTRSTCTPGPASRCPRSSGRSSSRRSSRPPRTGGRRTAGSGRSAASRSTSPPSKIMCWVALDRGVRLARLHDSHAIADKWQAIADEIHADILANGVDERGVLVQRYGSDALDASLLLAPLVRFLPPDDPRIRATVLAIADELTHEGLVLRYRVEETDDGLAGEEGTFTICSFWLVSALVEIGELERAQRALRAAAVARLRRSACTREELDPVVRPAPRQLPAGVHPPGADQRRHPRHPGQQERYRAHGFARPTGRAEAGVRGRPTGDDQPRAGAAASVGFGRLARPVAAPVGCAGSTAGRAASEAGRPDMASDDVAGRGLAAVAAAGALVLRSRCGTAPAEPPFRVPVQITDRAGALTGSDRADVQAAIDQLSSRGQRQPLRGLRRRPSTDPSGGQEWARADRAAVRPRHATTCCWRSRPAAAPTRSASPPNFPLSDSQLESIAENDIRPAARRRRLGGRRHRRRERLPRRARRVVVDLVVGRRRHRRRRRRWVPDLPPVPAEGADEQAGAAGRSAGRRRSRAAAGGTAATTSCPRAACRP